MMADRTDPPVAATLPAERLTLACRVSAAQISQSAARLTDRLVRMDQIALRPDAQQAELVEKAQQVSVLAADIEAAAGLILRIGDHLRFGTPLPPAIALREASPGVTP